MPDEKALREIEEALNDVVLRIPNLPADDVPDGRSEADNRVLRTHGYDPADYDGRSWAPHWEVAERLGIYDGERAAKLSGAMFSVLKGDGARLLRGLVNLGLALHRDQLRRGCPASPGADRGHQPHRSPDQVRHPGLPSTRR